MPMNQALLPEFDMEMAKTRECLSRVPDAKWDWKPHSKSMPMGRLAGHLAELVGFGTTIVQTEGMDLAQRPPDRKPLVAEIKDEGQKASASAGPGGGMGGMY